ncbi:MAG: ketol-acid reductoisomerase [Deltaproteobacteria bacterium]|nr:ketol-acid reductoisomerase [Deltaproteobacteria bacterium]
MSMGQKITFFGFGSQGRAQALNARDSGWKVEVFLRPESRRVADAQKEKLEVITDPIAAAKGAHVAILLVPDTDQPEFYKTVLEPHLPKEASLVFAHGFNIHFKQITPRHDLDCLLVAPALQGDGLRQNYLVQEAVPILTAISQDATDRAYRLVEDLAGAIGGKGTRVIPTTFKEETETDLFAEQTLTCGGLNQLIKAGFDTLVDAGYNPDIAYYCCLKEMKALAESIYRHGIQGMRGRISGTARYGDLTRGPRVIDEKVRDTMKVILDEICSGKFCEELLKDKNAGWPILNGRLKEEDEHLIEKVRNRIEK